MTPSRRSPVRGSVGNGGDPRLPDPADDARAYDDPEAFDDPEAPWGEDDDLAPPLGERIDLLRRKYMPLPDEVVYEFLGEDEYVVHSDHPSFRAFLTQNIMFVILIPIIGPLFIFFVQGGITREAVMIFLLLDLLVAVLALKRLGDRYTSYVITNLRLIKVTGIISRKLASIPWTRMTGLGYEQKALGRVLGYATIFIESANEESGLRKFSDVNDPATFHQRLLDMVSAKSGQTGRQPPAPTTGERQGLFQKRKERKRMAREASIDKRQRRTSGPPTRRPGPQPPTAGRPPTGEKTPSKGTPPTGARRPPREPVGPDDATPPDGTPEASEPPSRATPKAPGARRGASSTWGDEAEPEARRTTGPEQAEDTEPRRSKWSWWPGTGPSHTTAPVPPRPEDQEPKQPPPRKRRRRPDQRAPSQQPPETIIVPPSEQSRQRRKKPENPRRPGRFREIDGWS